jgi:hypothetical protein
MVGSPPAAPPPRWTSRYMLAPRNAADSTASPVPPRAQAASVVAARAATWRCVAPADGREQAPRAHRSAPPPQARPALRRGRPDDPERAHLATHRSRREPCDAVQGQRQRDGARRVEPAADGAPRADDDHRATGPAPVSPEQDPDHSGGAAVLNRTPLVPLAQAVAVEPQRAAWRPAGGATARAAPWARLVDSRGPRGPNLDGNLGLYESNVAPVAF